jgi:glycosyltransferase involved in cell wall biosynthesis
MPAVYRRADVVVVPSVSHEGTSLAAIEALMSARPLVTTHIGGLPNVVIPGLNGFMCDLTVESLANAIIGAMNSGPANEELIHATRVAFSKARWDEQILTFLASRLELDSGNKRHYE